MSHVNTIAKYDEKSQVLTDSNRFSACESVVEDLVEQGLPRAFNPSTFISKIARDYGISSQEARTCLKLAINQLEGSKKEKKEVSDEKMYAQSGYFYPSQGSNPSPKKDDGMDSLSSLGSYNRLMFAIR